MPNNQEVPMSVHEAGDTQADYDDGNGVFIANPTLK